MEEGTKSRPCAIVTAVVSETGGKTVYVLPITHSAPKNPQYAIEIPVAIKRNLRLDNERSWVICSEANKFSWPGFDLSPTPDGQGSYGVLPPRFFQDSERKLF